MRRNTYADLIFRQKNNKRLTITFAIVKNVVENSKDSQFQLKMMPLR